MFCFGTAWQLSPVGIGSEDWQMCVAGTSAVTMGGSVLRVEGGMLQGQALACV
jgi:hypothetical protein